MSIAEFSIPYIQILNEEAAVIHTLPLFAQNLRVLESMYRTMVFSRLFDKKAIALQRTGKIGTYAPIHGQEAIGTAIGHAMQTMDVLIPYYRDYAAQLQRGVKACDILAYWGGDERGSCFTSAAGDLPICVPIASQCLHAAGVAFSLQYKKEKRVAVVCVGDGGTSEGDFYEALNVAGVWQLPLVFVINNNQWAISVPLTQQTHAKTLAQKAISAGIEGIVVDGNDILALRQEIGKAIDKARCGQGPSVIEARSYRLCDHTTADDAQRYQPSSEVAAAQLREPIGRFKQFLVQHHGWTDSQEQTVWQTSQQVLEDEVQRYLTRPAQPLSAMFDFHFASLPDYLIEQRAMALESSHNA